MPIQRRERPAFVGEEPPADPVGRSGAFPADDGGERPSCPETLSTEPNGRNDVPDADR